VKSKPRYAYVISSQIGSEYVSGGILGVYASERRAWDHWTHCVSDRKRKFLTSVAYYKNLDGSRDDLASAYVISAPTESLRLQRFRLL
jgi:hypothetical protein